MAVEWGSVANWISGIGSLTASCVALYIAERNRRISLSGYVGKRVIIGGEAPQTNVLSISVTNVGTRPTKITNVGFHCGRGKQKKFAIVTVGVHNPKYPWLITDSIPKTLEDGESAHWQIPLSEAGNWIDNLVDSNFVQTWNDIETLRFSIYTSQGKMKLIRPEPSVREQLHDRIGTKAKTTGKT
jgi:hypothetical protein